MPTWAKWLIVFGLGVAVGKSPDLIVHAANAIQSIISRNG